MQFLESFGEYQLIFRNASACELCSLAACRHRRKIYYCDWRQQSFGGRGNPTVYSFMAAATEGAPLKAAAKPVKRNRLAQIFVDAYTEPEKPTQRSELRTR